MNEVSIYRNVLIIGKSNAINDSLIEQLNLLPDNIIIGNYENGFDINELAILNNKISNDTKIIVHAHGGIKEGKHSVLADKWNIQTSKLLRKLQSFAHTPLNIIFDSCYSGNIDTAIKFLKKGSLIAVSSKEGEYSYSLDEFEQSIFLSAEDDTNPVNFYQHILDNFIYHSARQGKIIAHDWSMRLKPPYEVVLDKGKAKTYLRSESDKFIEYVQSTYSIALVKPLLDDQSIENFQKFLFTMNCAIENSQWHDFMELNLGELADKKWLIENSFIGHTPIYMSVYNNIGLDLLKLFIELKAEVNANNEFGLTPLHIAIYEDKVEIIKLLIEANADVNMTDKYGYTPLHKAIEKGNPEIVKLILEAKADVNNINNYGSTPLHKAIGENKFEIVKLLLEAKADVFKSDNFGFTPFSQAISNGNIDIIKLILKEKVDVNFIQEDGDTPLSSAIYSLSNLPSSKVIDIMDLLIKCGANPSLKTGKYGLTLISIVKYRNFDPLIVQQMEDVVAGKIVYNEEDCYKAIYSDIPVLGEAEAVIS